MRIGLLLAALLLAGCTSGSAQEPAAPTTGAPAVLEPCPEQPGEPASGNAPEVVLECLGGGSLDLARAAGTPTVLNLWASWCQPCREELPLVQQLAERAGDRLRVVGVASQDGVPQATAFIEDAELTFPSAFDGEGDLAAALGLRGLPHTLFVGADGSVAHVEVGQIDTYDELTGLVAQHLGVQL
ncbi:TlpA family protein disulfide reductase [Blastococcus sp. PRF04-17]|uniref:TlpA family protein disulfide reductase n=1 Tax=Blastococcus sp. PRF04-17 TaxID=2933797 RepID=UPI001FF3480B|nr:TlpA disulfide reductase family protein [Blastococcus sp. PRF04-17]UOY00076.1 TlpA family protein disulfide reductase [Blastococcus sp. PRF04-17]